MTATIAVVREAAAEHGFLVAGVAPAAPLPEALDRLRAYCDAGHAGEMGWLSRNPPQRADPRTLLETARSVVSVAVNYWSPAPPFEAEGRYGRVARYAWGRDYHDVVIPRLRLFARTLSDRLGGCETKVASDQSPILERAFAERAGTGFVGKHTNLILPRGGSWWFLGEVVVDRELEPTAPLDAGACGACRLCLDACPTNAFVDAFRLDARRCISYWTIEQAGPIPREDRPRMGAWAFGCDVCQDVCPYDRFASKTSWPEFLPAAGVGPRLDLAATLAIRGDDEFGERFSGTALLRPGRAGLLRNAAIAARNVGATAAVPSLVACVESDRDPLVRGHALWALSGLDPARARLLAQHVRAGDPDSFVRDEAEAVLSGRA